MWISHSSSSWISVVGRRIGSPLKTWRLALSGRQIVAVDSTGQTASYRRRWATDGDPAFRLFLVHNLHWRFSSEGGFQKVQLSCFELLSKKFIFFAELCKHSSRMILADWFCCLGDSVVARLANVLRKQCSTPCNTPFSRSLPVKWLLSRPIHVSSS